MISPELCIRCKGKLLCGLNFCPILEKSNQFQKISTNFQGTKFEGNSPPSVFISWNNYPNVTIAPLAPAQILEKAELMDSPEQWFGKPMQEIISMRQQLIQSKEKINANSAGNPSYDLIEMQEIAMSEKPITLNIKLEKKPSLNVSFHESIAPTGPSAQLKELKLIENPKISSKVEYLYADTAVKSATALEELYLSGIPISSLHKLLSVGILGVKKNRKLVPTRWAITATDDTIGKKMLEKVKGFQQLSEIQLFHSNYLDNNFYILLIPANWSFEMMETWLPGGIWTQNATTFHLSTDFENFNGRKNYASNIEGAYYSARLGIAEHLILEKRQATAMVFREIGEGYSIPLGVWQIRENVRNALKQKPLTFSDLNLVFGYLKSKLKIPIEQYKKESKLLDEIKNQKKISEWF